MIHDEVIARVKYLLAGASLEEKKRHGDSLVTLTLARIVYNVRASQCAVCGNCMENSNLHAEASFQTCWKFEIRL